MNAVAVCPEGKDLSSEPSGLVTLVVFFSVPTMPAIRTAEIASDTAILSHELRLSTPSAFSPTITASGEYCR